MSALDTAKEIGRIATTAGLSKDVIDLLKEKVALLTDKIATLEQENTVVEGESANLKQKITDLQKELEGLRPKAEGLEETAAKFIKYLFESGSAVDFELAAAVLGVTRGKAAYYRDVLLNRDMITGAGMVSGDDLGSYDLTPQGREFAVKSGLV